MRLYHPFLAMPNQLLPVSVRTRLLSVDFLKALAVLLILNHRMRLSYGDWGQLATGGALGCALFFFLSGYMLANAQTHTLKEWVQKRLGRLLPPILIICFIGNFGAYRIFCTTFMWFIHCLIIYHISFYFIKRYMMKYIVPLTAIGFALYVAYFFLHGHAVQGYYEGPDMYGRNESKYFLYFIFYLVGVITKLHTFRPGKLLVAAASLFAPILLIAEMLLRYAAKTHHVSEYAVIASPVMMLCGIIALAWAASAMDDTNGTPSLARRLCAPILASVAALSLEAYIGLSVIREPLQLALLHLFPYNIPLVIIIVLFFCYFLRVCTRLFTAIISGKPEQLTLRYICAPY